jgi:hypothetical protein
VPLPRNDPGGPVNVVAFLISMGIFLFGMWLMGNASSLEGLQAITFFGGILCVAVAVSIPVSVLGRGDGA